MQVIARNNILPAHLLFPASAASDNLGAITRETIQRLKENERIPALAAPFAAPEAVAKEVQAVERYLQNTNFVNSFVGARFSFLVQRDDYLSVTLTDLFTSLAPGIKVSDFLSFENQRVRSIFEEFKDLQAVAYEFILKSPLNKLPPHVDDDYCYGSLEKLIENPSFILLFSHGGVGATIYDIPSDIVRERIESRIDPALDIVVTHPQIQAEIENLALEAGHPSYIVQENHICLIKNLASVHSSSPSGCVRSTTAIDMNPAISTLNLRTLKTNMLEKNYSMLGKIIKTREASSRWDFEEYFFE
jgi:hypothetical protein